ncbi:hypothetical protein SLE2022_283460 [Rubroshorea leprosula]
MHQTKTNPYQIRSSAGHGILGGRRKPCLENRPTSTAAAVRKFGGRLFPTVPGKYRVEKSKVVPSAWRSSRVESCAGFFSVAIMPTIKLA